MPRSTPLLLATALFLCSCIFVPRTTQRYDPACGLTERHMTLDAYQVGAFGGCRNEGCAELLVLAGAVSAASLGKLLDLLKSEVISGRIAKDVFAIMFETGDDPERIVDERGLKQVTDTGAIEAILDRLIADNPGQVASAQKNPKIAGWFTGQVMKATGGKANPAVVNQLVAAKLGLG